MLRIYKSVSRIYKLRAKILSLLFREEERKKKGRNIGTITMSSEHWSIEREAKNKGENARKQKDEGRATCRVSAITIVKNVADISPPPPGVNFPYRNPRRIENVFSKNFPPTIVNDLCSPIHKAPPFPIYRLDIPDIPRFLFFFFPSSFSFE